MPSPLLSVDARTDDERMRREHSARVRKALKKGTLFDPEKPDFRLFVVPKDKSRPPYYHLSPVDITSERSAQYVAGLLWVANPGKIERIEIVKVTYEHVRRALSPRTRKRGA